MWCGSAFYAGSPAVPSATFDRRATDRWLSLVPQDDTWHTREAKQSHENTYASDCVLREQHKTLQAEPPGGAMWSCKPTKAHQHCHIFIADAFAAGMGGHPMADRQSNVYMSQLGQS